MCIFFLGTVVIDPVKVHSDILGQNIAKQKKEKEEAKKRVAATKKLMDEKIKANLTARVEAEKA